MSSEVFLRAKFIPTLEESGYITKLDYHVYQTVYNLIEKRRKEGKRVVDIGVNLSRMDLMDKHIMDTILEDVKNSDLPSGSISYELTESAYAGVSEDGNSFLTKMHEEGTKLLVVVLEAGCLPLVLFVILILIF